MLIFSQTVGQCLGTEWQNCVAVIDTDAEIRSGDIVRLGLVINDRAHYVIKRLRTHRGAWFAQCDFGTFPISTYACVPDSVARVIGREVHYGAAPVDNYPRADAATRALYEQMTAEAREAWAAGDEQLGVPWPGLDAVVGPRPETHQIARVA